MEVVLIRIGSSGGWGCGGFPGEGGGAPMAGLWREEAELGGEGISVCGVCGREFRGRRSQRTYNLKQHLSIHAGLRPFQCPLCSHAFNRKSHLKGHLLARHGTTLPQ
ncbi:Zinc finger protein 710 [Portunus trituberculatus]|uniref:Zinc finger protein 710 n=1 Tax=Portunus trituberculatus TaxID=210409 RepID=A0A5B7JLR5_PORTR|nr:Zinc finger protein 710 [Portunus trituberculatus]